MRERQALLGLICVSGATLAGCAAGAVQPAALASLGVQLATQVLASSGGTVSEAASPQATCPDGSMYVTEAGACSATPFRIDRSPGAYGCANGAVVTGRGNVVCIQHLPACAPQPGNAPPAPAPSAPR